MTYDIVAIAIFIIVLAVNIGISWQKIINLSERVRQLEHTHSYIPSKEAMEKLTADIHAIKLSMVRLETIMEFRKPKQDEENQYQ